MALSYPKNELTANTGPSATSVCGLKLLEYAALSYPKNELTADVC